MPTITEQREAVDAVKQERYEAYQAYEEIEQARRLRDEMTDQCERIFFPMRNTFSYKLTKQGLASDLGELMRPVFARGLENAKKQAAVNGDWGFEVAREIIEQEEWEQIEAFASGLGEGVRITSMSLDGSDYEGIQAIAKGFGHDLPIGLTSEEILKHRMFLDSGAMVVLSPIPDAVRGGIDIGAYNKKRQKMMVRIITPESVSQNDHDSLGDLIRNTYDDVLTARHNVPHFAGRYGISDAQDAMTFVQSQTDLFDAHMPIVSRVYSQTSDYNLRNERLKSDRYNLSAALEDRFNNRAVKSLADAGDNARAEGREYTPDCPTGNAATAAQQKEQLGYRTEKWSLGACGNCKRTTMIWRAEDGGCNICHGCAHAHTNNGQAGLEGERKKADAERAKKAQQAKQVGRAGMRAAAKSAEKIDLTVKPDSTSKYHKRLVIGGVVKEEIKKC